MAEPLATTAASTEPAANSSMTPADQIQPPTSTSIEPSTQPTAPANVVTNGASTTPAAATNSITLRPPTTKPYNAASAAPSQPPTLSWLEEAWHVTHSSLPMWKKNRNVQIKYTLLPGGAIDDLITFQTLSGTKIKKVHGVDKPEGMQAGQGQVEKGKEPAGDTKANWAYHWRGKKLLAIASTRWEILGFGEEQGTGNKWVVTHFAKTLFTPAGVDIYSKGEKGLKSETIAEIKDGLKGLGNADLAGLVDKMFEIKMDGAREGK